jgi:hypothetical protein
VRAGRGGAAGVGDNCETWRAASGFFFVITCGGCAKRPSPARSSIIAIMVVKASLRLRSASAPGGIFGRREPALPALGITIARPKADRARVGRIIRGLVHGDGFTRTCWEKNLLRWMAVAHRFEIQGILDDPVGSRFVDRNGFAKLASRWEVLGGYPAVPIRE